MTPPHEPDRTVVVASNWPNLPPVGTVGEIVGGRGVRDAEEYCLRFPGLEVWLHLPTEGIELRGGDRALKPPVHRYGLYDPRWWAKILAKLGLYKYTVMRGTADERLLGRRIKITGSGCKVPIGSIGEIGGYEGPIYILTFRPYFAEVWTTLPAKDIEILPSESD